MSTVAHAFSTTTQELIDSALAAAMDTSQLDSIDPSKGERRAVLPVPPSVLLAAPRAPNRTYACLWYWWSPRHAACAQ